MWNFFSKFLSGFCYGAGFLLALICVFYVVSQYSNGSTQLVSSPLPSGKSASADVSEIKVKNIAKLSNFTNYSNEGRKEEFIFTGELENPSSEINYVKLMIEVDLYDVSGKFIFKCGGWDGVGLELKAGSTTNFQKRCFQMPSTIVQRYDSHKVNIRQRKF